MKLTKEQRQALNQAAIAALRTHFTGDGAVKRSFRFAWDALVASGGWIAKLLFIASWAVVGGLLAGPEHEYFLAEVRAWMITTPLEQVLAQTHSGFLAVFWECVKGGVVFGILQKMYDITKPAMTEVRQQFMPA